MDREEKILRWAEIVIEIGPDVAEGVIALIRTGKVTAEKIQAMKDGSLSPQALLAEHGISLGEED